MCQLNKTNHTCALLTFTILPPRCKCSKQMGDMGCSSKDSPKPGGVPSSAVRFFVSALLRKHSHSIVAVRVLHRAMSKVMCLGTPVGASYLSARPQPRRGRDVEKSSFLFKRVDSASSIVGCWTKVFASSVRMKYNDTHTSPLSTHNCPAHTTPWHNKQFEGVAKSQGVSSEK